jgi:hypothetical protein
MNWIEPFPLLFLSANIRKFRRSKQNISKRSSFFSTTFSRPFKDQAGAWCNGTSFGLNELKALMNVAFEAKE